MFGQIQTRFKDDSAFSSIWPIELYRKYEERRRANEKILISWLLSSSRPPIPSESTTITLIGSPSGVKPDSGVPQIQIPFVHGLIEGPTPNPLYLFKRTLLRKYDFPVRYMPATATTPRGPLTFCIIETTSGFNS